MLPERRHSMAGGRWAPLIACACLQHNPARMSTDGRAIALALEYVKAEAALDGGAKIQGRADLSKIFVGGFSMGAVEAINAAALLKGQICGLIAISPSLRSFRSAFAFERMYNFRSDDMMCKVKGLSVRSLWITSEGDALRDAAMTYSSPKSDAPPLSARAELVIFKDSSIDQACTSYVGVATNWLPSLVRAVPGLTQHFALCVSERQVVSVLAVVRFVEAVVAGTTFEAVAGDLKPVLAVTSRLRLRLQ